MPDENEPPDDDGPHQDDDPRHDDDTVELPAFEPVVTTGPEAVAGEPPPPRFRAPRGPLCLEVTVEWAGRTVTRRVENDAAFGRRGEIVLPVAEVANNHGRFAARDGKVMVVNAARDARLRVDGLCINSPKEIAPTTVVTLGPYVMRARLLTDEELA